MDSISQMMTPVRSSAPAAAVTPRSGAVGVTTVPTPAPVPAWRGAPGAPGTTAPGNSLRPSAPRRGGTSRTAQVMEIKN